MSESTFEDYQELAGAVIYSEYPILPRASWGQDAAYIAFVLDQQHANLTEALALLESVRFGGMRETWSTDVIAFLDRVAPKNPDPPKDNAESNQV